MTIRSCAPQWPARGARRAASMLANVAKLGSAASEWSSSDASANAARSVDARKHGRQAGGLQRCRRRERFGRRTMVTIRAAAGTANGWRCDRERVTRCQNVGVVAVQRAATPLTVSDQRSADAMPPCGSSTVERGRGASAPRRAAGPSSACDRVGDDDARAPAQNRRLRASAAS